jgi:hypothetical protein
VLKNGIRCRYNSKRRALGSVLSQQLLHEVSLYPSRWTNECKMKKVRSEKKRDHPGLEPSRTEQK